jgi:hypothetical protein
LLPTDSRPIDGVRLVALRRPELTLRAYAAIRSGRESWAPLRLVARLLTASPPARGGATSSPRPTA